MSALVTDRLIGVIAREQTGNRTDLYDDAAQEARIAVWQAAKSRPNASAPYLMACARNAAKGVAAGRAFTGEPRHRGRPDAHRTAVALEPIVDYLATLPAPAVAEEAPLSAELEAALDVLAPREREVVELLYLRGMPQTVVADELGMTDAAHVRQTLRRALPKLRAALEVAA